MNEVEELFLNFQKNENFRVKFGKIHIMLFRHHSLRITEDFDEKIGGYNPKYKHFYFSKVFVHNNKAENIVRNHGFVYEENGNGHSFWVLSGDQYFRVFQKAVEDITDCSIKM
jgi:hypothetical protein